VKILFSISYYHPYISGLSLAALRWAEGLAQMGDTVTVLCMQHDTSLPSVARVRKVRIHRASWIVRISKGFLSFDWVVQSWRLVQKNDVAVIHVPQLEGLVVALVAKLLGKRVVSVYHCELVLPPGQINTIIQSVVEIVHFFILLLSDVVITYTRDYANHSRLLNLWRRYTKRTVVCIIPPIPTFLLHNKVTMDIKKRIGKRDIVIGIAARLAAEKGIEYVLEALVILQKSMKQRNIKIVIAGPENPVGEQAYKKRITSLVKKCAASVVFLGSIEPKDMGSFYTVIDVLVLPSINSTEAFGMVQVEAMRYGVPVVASDLPGVRVPIQKTGMGIVVPAKNSRALAEAIATIVHKKPQYVQGKVMAHTLGREHTSIELFKRAII